MNLNDEVKQLLQLYEEVLLRYAGSLLRDQEEARDLCQTVFLKYISFRRQGGKAEHPKAWLFRVTYNQAMDYLRKKRLRHAVPEKENQASTEMGPDKILSRREALDLMWGKVNELNPNEQRVLQMRIKDELSYKDIAKQLDISVNHAGILLHRALKNLTRKIKTSENVEVKND